MSTEMTIKPIETEYNGHKFRSRLEARWAVFFDKASIKYTYEAKGYEDENGNRYLPDFYLPDFDTHVEVKGDRPEAWDELIKASKMIKWGGEIRRILILSEIPTIFDGGMWHFPCMYWRGQSDDMRVGWWFFQSSGDRVIGHISRSEYIEPFWINDDEIVCTCRPEMSFQAVSDTVLRNELWWWRELRGKPTYGDKRFQYEANSAVFNALKEAAEARFEYGETPKGDQK